MIKGGLKGGPEAAYRERLFHALKHPDCPVTMTEWEMERLSDHISIRLSRYGTAAKIKQLEVAACREQASKW